MMKENEELKNRHEEELKSATETIRKELEMKTAQTTEMQTNIQTL